VNTASNRRQQTNTNRDSNVDESRSELSISELSQTISIIDASNKSDNELHNFVKLSYIESSLTESDNDSDNDKLRSNFEGRVFQETMAQYDSRVLYRCEAEKGCCALRILEAQDYFSNEVSLLETVILAAGHEVIFCPKFHCELNYIEYYWAHLKRYTRENCKYSFIELENTIFQAMDNV
jgi:hypothetical protein